MFRMRLKVNEDRLATLRALPARAKRNLRRHLQTDFREYLQELVDTLLPSLEPESAAYPFQFGTEKSRWYYIHVMIPEGLVETDGAHYIRSGNMDDSWEVTVSDQLIENLVKITNPTEAARYTYGPWTVAGHKISGWGAEFGVAQDLLREAAIARLDVIWRLSIEEAARGIG